MKHQYYERLNRVAEGRQRYLAHYEHILRVGLASERSYMNDDTQLLIRLCRMGDAYVVATSLKIIEEVFMGEPKPLPRLLALKVCSRLTQLLNEMIRAGEFEAIEFSRKLTPMLVEQVDKIEGSDLTLKRGARMFEGEEGAKYSRIYYCQVLKSIVMWSHAISRDPFRITKSNYESQFVKAYRHVKDIKKYELPNISQEDISAFENE